MRSPSFYASLRIVQVGTLALGALVMAGILRVDQYALYARGALFSTAFTAVYLLGQDQLSYQGRLRLRTFRWRVLAIQGGVGVIVGLLILSSTPVREWLVLASSCLGTAAMTVTSTTWVSLQSQGRDELRALGQFGNAIAIQLAALAVAAITGSALWATCAATTMALLWLVGSLSHVGDSGATDAPVRAALGIGLGAASYGLMGAALSIIIGIRATDVSASQDRILLLVLSGVLAACSALNSEYFRNRLYSAQSRLAMRQVSVDLKRANLLIGAIVAAAVVAAAFVLPAALPSAYRGLYYPVLELAVVVPFLFLATACFTIEIARGRTLVSNVRNMVVAVMAPAALILIAPTPGDLVVIVLATEGSGAVIAAGSLALSHHRSEATQPDRKLPT